MKITITNTQEFITIDEEKIRKILLSIPNITKKFRLSVVYVDDAEITKLNERYLKHEGPTDVLAFPYDNQEGEVIVSAETALREATERKVEPEGELVLYTVHGILHLMGHDDHTEEEARIMHGIEKNILISSGYSWQWGENEPMAKGEE